MDYTKEIDVLCETFRILLDESVVDKMFISSKYAKVVTIKIHPAIMKLFSTRDIINFAIFDYKSKSSTSSVTEEDLDGFIKDKMDYKTFAFISLIYRTFSPGDIYFIETLHRLHNPTEIREDGNLYEYSIPTTITNLWKNIPTV